MALIGVLAICASVPALAQVTPLPEQERSQTRIVGGYEATPGAWPWMAALVYAGETPVDGQYCGGVLIHPKWVATAGHCADGTNASFIEVYVGLHDLRDTSEAEQHSVKRIVENPNFGYVGSGYPDYDIALLELDEPSNFQPIRLASQDDPQGLTLPGILSRTIGWGKLTENSFTYPDVLYEVQVPIVSQQVAIDGYGSENITNRMIAAGYVEGGKDACQGDSGGPLMVPSSDGLDWVLAGLVSWGDGCARPNKVGIYSRISACTSWISGYVPNVDTGYYYESYIPYVSYYENEFTGIALSNAASAAAATAQIEYYENDGDLVGSSELTFPAHGQSSFIVPHKTGTGGWARVLSDRPLRGLALLGGPDNKPLYDVDMQTSASTDLLAAHFDLTPNAWDSTIMACNPSDTAATLTFKLYTVAGALLTPNPARSIPANGALQVKINDLYPSHTATGSLEISSSGDGVAAFLLYDGTQSGNSWRAGLSVLPK